MNTNWSKILLFSLLSFVLGWLVAHYVCRGHGRCGGGGCGGDRMECHGGHMGDMGGSCCKSGMGKGHAGCMHGGGGCGGSCKGKCDGACEGECGGTGMHHACCHGGGDAEAHAVIEKIKASDFQGDTTVAIEGGTVTIHKEGDQMKVEVQMTDSAHHGMEEKTVEVHTH